MGILQIANTKRFSRCKCSSGQMTRIIHNGGKLNCSIKANYEYF
jgi:hypothetical protein